MNPSNIDCKRYCATLNHVNVAIEILIQADYSQESEYRCACKYLFI